MIERLGKTIILKNKPTIIGYGSIVGKKEHEGPLSDPAAFCIPVRGTEARKMGDGDQRRSRPVSHR